MPSTYQNLLKFMEIWRSSDRNKNAQFLETTVYIHYLIGKGSGSVVNNSAKKFTTVFSSRVIM